MPHRGASNFFLNTILLFMPQISYDRVILTGSAHEIRTASFLQNIANTAQLIKKAWVEKQSRGLARTNALCNVCIPSISSIRAPRQFSVICQLSVCRLELSGIICRHQEQIISETPARYLKYFGVL